MLLRVLKSLLSEKQLPSSEWDAVLPIVQASLNLQPASRLKGVAPVTAFLALPAATSLKSFYSHTFDGDLPLLTPVALTEAIQDHVQALQQSLTDVHRELSDFADAKAARERARANKQVKNRQNFEVGDYVLVGRALARPNKLALQWKGPCRIVEARSEWIFDVQSLYEPITVTTHHVSRLKFFSDGSRNEITDLVEYAVAHQDVFLVDHFLQCRPANGSWEFLVQWQGFEAVEATWEPLGQLLADVPALVRQTLANPPHESFKSVQLSH
jgi:hypothetical protein